MEATGYTQSMYLLLSQYSRLGINYGSNIKLKSIQTEEKRSRRFFLRLFLREWGEEKQSTHTHTHTQLSVLDLYFLLYILEEEIYPWSEPLDNFIFLKKKNFSVSTKSPKNGIHIYMLTKTPLVQKRETPHISTWSPKQSS